jgi:hypothetical protein
MSATDELLTIGETVQTYFEGMHHGDVGRLRAVVHSDAFVAGYYQGTYTRQSLTEWMTEVEGLDKPAESGEAFDMRIVSIDISARVAMVKVAVLYLGLRFTDYLTLAKITEQWSIVHKAYVHD